MKLNDIYGVKGTDQLKQWLGDPANYSERTDGVKAAVHQPVCPAPNGDSSHGEGKT